MNSWYHEPANVLLVDDDHDILNLLTIAFRGAGYETECASSGAMALTLSERKVFSLIVLDINMPAPNGLQVCAAVRRNSNVPVLMLSARDQEQDLLQALDAGADAYVVKPFSPRALIARAHALLRRFVPSKELLAPNNRFKLDLDGLALAHPGGGLQLTKLETRVLRLLMLNPGKLVGTGELVAEVWNSYDAANRNMLKQVIFRLRRKLSAVPEAHQALKTNAGGYMWCENTPVQADANC